VKIKASDLQIGDYIHGVGTVQSINKFGLDTAVGDESPIYCQRVTGRHSSNKLYREAAATLAARENYTETPDKVSVTLKCGTLRSFKVDTELNIVRPQLQAA
jgi:hypothetical protein